MTTSICRICTKPVEAMFSSVLLQKYSTQYFKCSQCGYVQTEHPHWLEEAYESSINDSDTGMIMRNLWHRNITATLIYFLFNNKGRFLDYGSGYGVFVRLMRDVGFDFSWQDKLTAVGLVPFNNFPDLIKFSISGLSFDAKYIPYAAATPIKGAPLTCISLIA